MPSPAQSSRRIALRTALPSMRYSRLNPSVVSGLFCRSRRALATRPVAALRLAVELGALVASCRWVLPITTPRAGIRASPSSPRKAVLCVGLRPTGWQALRLAIELGVLVASCRWVLPITTPRPAIRGRPFEPRKAVLCVMLRMTGSHPSRRAARLATNHVANAEATEQA